MLIEELLLNNRIIAVRGQEIGKAFRNVCHVRVVAFETIHDEREAQRPLKSPNLVVLIRRQNLDRVTDSHPPNRQFSEGKFDFVDDPVYSDFEPLPNRAP